MLKKKSYQILLCENKWEKYLLGDVDGNGIINDNDVNLINNLVADRTTLEKLYDEYFKEDMISFNQFKTILDITKDKKINLLDGRKIQQIINGIAEVEEIVFSHSVPVLEIGSSTSDFNGQAFNIEFYSKIDGTHELSFELPRFYFDTGTGKMVFNELVELLVNKCEIELRIEDKTYFMIINSRTDKEEKGNVISYSYSCNDVFIEELSKTGYGLVFSDEVEGNGLGTIHELAQQAVDGTEWEYKKENTGTLYEYKKDLEYNINQGRYDEVHIPIPVHKVKYIPELKRYCNELKVFKSKVKYEPAEINYHLGDVNSDGKITSVDARMVGRYVAEPPLDLTTFLSADYDQNGEITSGDEGAVLKFAAKCDSMGEEEKQEQYEALKRTYKYSLATSDSTYHRIYCYEDSEQITSNTVQNYISNSDDFIDYIGWQTYDYTEDNSIALAGGAVLSSEKISNDYLLKVTPLADRNIVYLLNEGAAETNKSIQGNTPYAFTWTAGANTKAKITKIHIYGKNPLSNPGILPEYTGIAPKTSNFVFEDGKYYTIKPKTSIFHPYIVFEIDCNNEKFYAKNFSFFPVKGKNTDNYTDNSETNNLSLLSELVDGVEINEANRSIMQFPADAPSAYTHHQVRYFIRDNYEIKNGVEQQIIKDSEKDTITYLDFEEVNNSNNFINDGDETFSPFLPLSIYEVDELPESSNTGKIYRLKKDGKYYQYYSITVGDRENGTWDYALYDEGNNDKRRTLSVERSNRFNIIQNLAELFKVWPVFNTYRDAKGIIKKELWFREKCIKENFSGFHKGVNLTSLSRTINTDEIVTKIYVEDIDCDFTDDGFVTIRKSPLNPWSENYYYNFQYYINQKLINTTLEKDGVTLPIIQHDLNDLYTSVKGKNSLIFDLNDKIANAKIEVTNLRARLTSLATSIAAMVERVASINADLQSYENDLGEPDKQKLENNLSNYSEQKEKYEIEKNKTQVEYDVLINEIETWQQEVSTLVSEKKELINAFENKYSQFIKEGVWSDSSYVDNTTYYLDSLDVMNTSSMPKIDWSIEVVDGSFDKDFEIFKFEVGDQTFLIDDEFFMKAPQENYKFDVLITGIKEFLDMPTKNIIEVRNYRTSFEDIFQRISAATQTLELKEQTYDKAANFTNNGQVDQSIIQNTLLNNALILANSTDNSYILDSTGLHLQSIINPTKKLRAIADGIFISNSVDGKGQPKWMTGITAEGINASVITSGEINTSVIKIFSKGTPSFSWNELGITAYKYKSGKVDSNAFMRFDSFGLYSVDDIGDGIIFNYDTDGKAWFEQYRNNRDNALKQIIDNALVSITDKGFNLNVKNGNGSIRLGYKTNDDGTLSSSEYGLYIKDTSGNLVVQLQNDGANQIAGWKIDKYALTNYQKTDQKNENGDILYRVFGMQTSDAPSSVNALAIGLCKNPNDSWGGAAFRVTHDGQLFATGAVIEGSISVGNGGTIGGWKITNGDLQRVIYEDEDEEKPLYRAIIQAGTHIESGSAAFATQSWNPSTKTWENTFYTTYGGDGYFKGTVFATSGEIGGCKIVDGHLQVDSANIGTLSVSRLTGGTNNNEIHFNNFFSNGGNIAGWDTDASGFISEDNTVGLTRSGVYFNASGTNYYSEVSLTRATITVPGNLTLPPSFGSALPSISWLTTYSSGISFYTNNKTLGISKTAFLYFTGGVLCLNIENKKYSITMTELE